MHWIPKGYINISGDYVSLNFPQEKINKDFLQLIPNMSSVFTLQPTILKDNTSTLGSIIALTLATGKSHRCFCGISNTQTYSSCTNVNLLKTCHKRFGSNYFTLFLYHYYSNPTLKNLCSNAGRMIFSFLFPLPCNSELF